MALTNMLVDMVDVVNFVDVADVLDVAGTVKALGYVKGAWVVPWLHKLVRSTECREKQGEENPFIPRLSIPCYSLPCRYFHRHATFCYCHWIQLGWLDDS